MGEDHLQLLARILTAPFRLAARLFQTVVMMLFLVVALIVTPFLSFILTPSYQHKANETLVNDRNRVYMLMDFSTNSTVAIPWDNNFAEPPYPTQVPEEADYKTYGADDYGHIPAGWAFGNMVGFYGDFEGWERGKEAPMYVAYSEAATSSDSLRKALSEFQPHAHIRLTNAPKVMMAWRAVPNPTVMLFGVAPANHVDMSKNLQFKEARELFTPSLTVGQAEAVAQMQFMMSDDYWLREAHANGIYDEDEGVTYAAQQNRKYLSIRFTQYTGGGKLLVYLEFGYLLLVFSFLLFVIVRVVRFIVY
jgi:hypothetical protein